MRSYTAHLKTGRLPVLVREGFSWGALLFGPFWLAAHRAWIPAVLLLATLVLAALAPPGVRLILLGGLVFLAGLLGRDMLRWSLGRRGYTLAHVLAARDQDGALARLLTARSDVAAQFAEGLGR